MMHRLLLTCLGLTTLFTSGCLFWKKTPKEKENPSISGSVEESFRTRWIDKRTTELVAGGQAADAARAQAAREFAERYDFKGDVKKE